MAEWSKAPDSRAKPLRSNATLGVLVSEWRCGFESHFWHFFRKSLFFVALITVGQISKVSSNPHLFHASNFSTSIHNLPFHCTGLSGVWRNRLGTIIRRKRMRRSCKKTWNLVWLHYLWRIEILVHCYAFVVKSYSFDIWSYLTFEMPMKVLSPRADDDWQRVS